MIAAAPAVFKVERLEPQHCLPQEHFQCDDCYITECLQVPTDMRLIAYADLKNQVVIGEGGFGKVLSAKLDGFTEVVLKTSKVAGAINRASITKELRFMKDMQDHRNVARVLGVCADMPSGELGIIMDRCEYSLAMYLQKHAPKVRSFL